MQQERDIEDYICQHQDEFIKKLENIFNLSKVGFVGRQVKLGDEHIIDLLYYYDEIDKGTPSGDVIYRNFIIVELKNRPLIAKDFAQLARYMSVLNNKLDLTYETVVNSCLGVFVAPSIGEEVKNMLTAGWIDSDVRYITFDIKLEFHEESDSYSWKEEYIKQVELDRRITKSFEETRDGQPDKA